MKLPFEVTDHYSNAPELIVAAAKAIGKSELKLKVFCEVYRHKQRVKSVQEIADAIRLDRMQVLQTGGSLKKSGLIGQGKKERDTAYSQIEFYQHNKDKILRLVADPSKIPAVVTKRNPLTSPPVSAVNFLRPRRVPVQQVRAKASKSTKIRIAFLATNPMETASLRTDLEAREVLQASGIVRRAHLLQVKGPLRLFSGALQIDGTGNVFIGLPWVAVQQATLSHAVDYIITIESQSSFWRYSTEIDGNYLALLTDGFPARDVLSSMAHLVRTGRLMTPTPRIPLG